MGQNLRLRENLATTQMRRLWLTCAVGSPSRRRASLISAIFPVSTFHTVALRFIAAPWSFLSSPKRTSTVSFSSMASGDEGAVFNLSDSSFLKILKGDITKWSVDATSDAIVSLSLSLSFSINSNSRAG